MMAADIQQDDAPVPPLPHNVREAWIHAHMIRAGLHAARGLATPPAEPLLAPMAEPFAGRWCDGCDSEGGDCA
jgi:hypothetical protein